ncbi:MAG: hypothetical protein AAF664_25570 [Planctomycetota bacterium]
MIELPWQVVAAFAGVWSVWFFVSSLRRTDCQQMIRDAQNQSRRDAIAAHREGFKAGFNDGQKYEVRDRGEQV